MEREAYRKTAYDMIRLVRCSLEGGVPDKAWVETLDLAALYEVSQEHLLTACTAYALESAGIQDKDFSQAKMKAIRKNILLDAERKKVLDRLEQEHIWYMPLKGVYIKEWYPKLGMRQMSDNDILCDVQYRRRIREIMEELGFTCAHWGSGHDDAYYKPPVSNFEMHLELFRLTNERKLYDYYVNVRERLCKDEGNAYGYHFRMEDFYNYVTAHEYKHFTGGGTGVRTLVDTYVIMRKFHDTMDWDYLDAELEKLGIAQFEKQNRELAMKLFSGETLSEEERSLLDYYIFSGTYGVLENEIGHEIGRVGRGSRAKYIFHRIFPSMEHIRTSWNFFYRHKWLIPVLWIYRPICGLIKNGKHVKGELKYLSKKK